MTKFAPVRFPLIELSNVKGITMLFCFNVKQCYSCANYLMEITVNKLFTVISIK